MPKRALAAFVLSGLLLMPVSAGFSLEERRAFVGSIIEAIEADPQRCVLPCWHAGGTTDLPAALVQLEIDHLLRMARMDGREIPDWEWSQIDTRHRLTIEVDDSCLRINFEEDYGKVTVSMHGPMTCEQFAPGAKRWEIIYHPRTKGYPELAKVAGIEARVVIERVPSPPGESPALRVLSTSSEYMGFEQVAMESVEGLLRHMKLHVMPDLYEVWFVQYASPR